MSPIPVGLWVSSKKWRRKGQYFYIFTLRICFCMTNSFQKKRPRIQVTFQHSKLTIEYRRVQEGRNAIFCLSGHTWSYCRLFMRRVWFTWIARQGVMQDWYYLQNEIFYLRVLRHFFIETNLFLRHVEERSAQNKLAMMYFTSKHILYGHTFLR